MFNLALHTNKNVVVKKCFSKRELASNSQIYTPLSGNRTQSVECYHAIPIRHLNIKTETKTITCYNAILALLKKLAAQKLIRHSKN